MVVAKGKSSAQEVKESRTYKDATHSVRALPEAVLREYIDHPVASADVKAALAKFLRLRAAVAETSAQLTSVSKQLAELTTDQARLRSNLQIVLTKATTGAMQTAPI